MKFALIINLLLLCGITKGQENLLDYFEVIESDSFHIRPFNYFKSAPPSLSEFKEFKGKEIPKNFHQLATFDTLFHPVNFFANEAIKVDSLNYAAITVIQTQNIYESFILILILNENGELQSFIQAASFSFLDSSKKETQNCWIFDEDKDDDLDICVMSELVDYETPTKDSPNISDATAILFRNNEGQFKLDNNISEKLWELLKVQK